MSDQEDEWDDALESAYAATGCLESINECSKQRSEHGVQSDETIHRNFVDLPDECVLTIYRQISSAEQICMLSMACRKFRTLATSSKIWQNVFSFRYGDPEDARPREHPVCLGTCDDRFAGDYRRMYQHWHRTDRNWRSERFAVRSLEGHSGGVAGCELRSDTLVTVGQDCCIRWWDLTSEALNCAWTENNAHRGPIWGLRVREEFMATSSSDGTVKVWVCGSGPGSNAAGGAADRRAECGGGGGGGGGEVTSAAVSDASPVRCIQTLRGHLAGEVWCVDMSDSSVFSGARDCTVRVWDRETGHNYQTLAQHKESVFTCQFAGRASADAEGGPGGADLGDCMILTAGGDGIAMLWDLRTGRPVQHYAGHSQSIFCADLAPAQGQILTGSGDGTVRRYDLRAARCAAAWGGHTDAVWALHYNSLARRAVTGSVDCGIRLWDAFDSDTGACLGEFKCHLEPVMSVTADAGRAVSGDAGGWVFLWDFQPGAAPPAGGEEGEDGGGEGGGWGPPGAGGEYYELMSHMGPI